MYIHIYIFFICKQYMTKAYTLISFHYMLILSWVFFFLLVIVLEGIPSSIRPRVPPKKELERHRSGVLNGIIPPLYWLQWQFVEFLCHKCMMHDA